MVNQPKDINDLRCPECGSDRFLVISNCHIKKANDSRQDHSTTKGCGMECLECECAWTDNNHKHYTHTSIES